MDSYTETLARARIALREKNLEALAKSTPLTEAQIARHKKYSMPDREETSTQNSQKNNSEKE